MNTNDNYTNLIQTYIYKLIVFLGVAALTLCQAKTFNALLVGAISYLIGILFDLLIIAKTNSGPKLKIRRSCSYFLHYLLMVIIVVMLCLLIGNVITDESVQERITLVIYILVFGYTLLGSVMEIVSNCPVNN